MKSKKLIAHFKLMSNALDRLHKVTSCSATNKAGMEYTEEERKRVYEASRKLNECREIVVPIWADRIGKAITTEIRCGTYKN